MISWATFLVEFFGQIMRPEMEISQFKRETVLSVIFQAFIGDHKNNFFMSAKKIVGSGFKNKSFITISLKK